MRQNAEEETELSRHCSSLELFLQSKPLFYKEIDTARMPRVYEKVKSHFNYGKVIHIIGTNGKGTTGRFIASALHKHGAKVGHYTSPHILRFNERIWIDGSDVSDEKLNTAHSKLLSILEEKDALALSYFEYTTLLAFICFEGCDYIVLEAGLGGEYDATNVVEKELSVVTPIGFDHEAFLGGSIKSIATTKLNAIGKNVIVGYQKYDEVCTVAKYIAKIKSSKLTCLKELDKDELTDMAAHELKLADYLKDNLALAVEALKMLGLSVRADDFRDAVLFGRMSLVVPNIYLDVGHNELAASAVAEYFKGDKISLIYNTYADKNFEKILRILKPIVKEVEILKVQNERMVPPGDLEDILKALDIPFKPFLSIEPNKTYLVFGSFSVAEKFLSDFTNLNKTQKIPTKPSQNILVL